MMIKNKRVQEDPWTHLEDEAPLCNDSFTVSWSRWQSLRTDWPVNSSPMGVRVPPDVRPQDLGEDAHRFALIIIEYPKFTDGRGYSLAFLLRTRFAYTGELRASGYVTREQVGYLERCGFDSFLIKEGKDPHAALKGFGELAMRYQPSADGVLPIWRHRVESDRSQVGPVLPLSPTRHGESQG